MVLLGDEAQLKARFGRFGDIGNIDARWVHGLRRTFHRLINHFGHTRWKRTIGSEIILDALDGTPR